jgi:hypothetical protein
MAALAVLLTVLLSALWWIWEWVGCRRAWKVTFSLCEVQVPVPNYVCATLLGWLDHNVR